MVAPSFLPSVTGGNEGGGECIQTLFHCCARNHLLMVFPRQVIIIDLDIHQAVGVIAIDKSHPNIIQGFYYYIKLPVLSVSRN